MKHISIIAIIVLLVVSCKQEQSPKDYLILEGKITNPIDSLNLRLFDPIANRTIMVDVDEQGNFNDTIKIEKPATFTAVYKNIFSIFLKNNMDVKTEFNTEDFNTSLKFSGNGANESNFLKIKSAKTTDLFGENYKDYLSLDKADFDKKTDTYIEFLKNDLRAKATDLDSTFVLDQKLGLDKFKEEITAQHKEQQTINKTLGKGNPSPQFVDYVNYKGGTNSLSDYKGSYVYIDVWATWCAPCKYEIPFLEKVEKQYHDKNIKFVSLSIDRIADEKKWRAMIKDKNMSGIQLLADNDFESQFVKDYFIYGIPRFILIDPNGNIVNYDAPRPSEEKLIELFNSLNI
ncbi:TlpA family protein disulfide reductase [Xanthomarina sp. F2636L]|uniref:TlpA family protein disulfide reductase n=1 Tax=Xanthomarina sp. F2636L TaxID=2996018 RepID=UPI00225E31A7|nr:TlpA disulfide reductase family protein [Xanthomarina sp. F2636L]MCX7550061.1 TlpA disulfide reductase family protein [Xanthomarina sp. F2636L]